MPIRIVARLSLYHRKFDLGTQNGSRIQTLSQDPPGKLLGIGELLVSPGDLVETISGDQLRSRGQSRWIRADGEHREALGKAGRHALGAAGKLIESYGGIGNHRMLQFQLFNSCSSTQIPKQI